MAGTIDDVVRIIETWQTQRVAVFERQTFDDGTNPASLREFVEINNRCSRRLISLLEKQDPEFWSALMELAGQAQTITTGAKTFVNGQDRSSEGM